MPCDFDRFSRHVQDPGRADIDPALITFTASEIETSGAGQLNGRDRFVHHGSGSGQQTYIGQCLPVHKQGSASSVGSVASSAKLSAAGNAVSRSSSSDITGSFSAAQHEVSQFSFNVSMWWRRSVVFSGVGLIN